MNPAQQGAQLIGQAAGLGPSAYSYQPNGAGGYNYFQNTGGTLNPITREQYATGSGNPYPVDGSVQGASTQQQTTGGTGTATTGTNQALVQQLLGSASGIVGHINDLYNTIYGQGGAFDTGLQNSRDLIESGYVPQYNNVGLQANQLAQQLAWQNLANGTGASSFAGQQEQNLAGQAQNEAGQITSAKQKDLENLASNAQKQKGTDLSNQQTMNANLALYNQVEPTDTSGLAPSVITNFINGLNQTQGTLSGDIAGNAPAGQLASSLNAAAPSQIYNPGQLNQGVQSILQSSLPSYLQGVLSSAFTAANSNPGDLSYYTQLQKNLNPTAS